MFSFTLPGSFLLSSILYLFSSSSVLEATVSPSNTFKYVNEGEFGEYSVEYGANYRILDILEFPFSICFYNTTPNAFTLGLKFGTHHSESIMRWAWDANRGNPVKENATLTFGRDGNLVLADVDGRIAWQTNTANKGVVNLKLLQNGNLVLYDRRGKYVWQSFDYPTDTLLVGQGLRPNGPSKLVSRLSNLDGSVGAYSYVLEKNRLAMYQKTKNSLKPLLYYTSDEFSVGSHFTFNSIPRRDRNFNESEPYAHTLLYEFGVNGSSDVDRSWFLSEPKFNTTLTMLRLESNGNLKMYTYSTKVDSGAWDVTYTLFSRDRLSECKLPTRCGSLGVCEDNQCVACPTEKGLLGWSKDCAPPKHSSCVGGKGVKYFKVEGVEHYVSSEGDGPMALGLCKEKCDKDCGCLGFFYRMESSKCLLAPELGTLTKVSNSSHVAYIKTEPSRNSLVVRGLRALILK